MRRVKPPNYMAHNKASELRVNIFQLYVYIKQAEGERGSRQWRNPEETAVLSSLIRNMSKVSVAG